MVSYAAPRAAAAQADVVELTPQNPQADGRPVAVGRLAQMVMTAAPADPTAAAPANALTVDLEDYYQVEGFADVVPRTSWPGWPARVELGCQRLLELFAQAGRPATFFTLGYVAERHPALVREIAAAGHEIACHGYDHRLVYRQTPEQLRSDLRRARGLLEDLLGVAVNGYRAPCYSITARSTWALDVLAEEGIHYDSSVFPIYHDRYGLPGAPRFPHLLRRPAGPLVELPPSTWRLGRLNLPLAGGGYFRLLPYRLFRAALRQINRRECQPAIFMIHPWELDPDQPLIKGQPLNVWRHRVGLSRTGARLRQLLRDFTFVTAGELAARVGSSTIQVGAG
jgi:polysaccharide deacetylase family protein (PEP-CTERM system associated)